MEVIRTIIIKTIRLDEKNYEKLLIGKRTGTKTEPKISKT